MNFRNYRNMKKLILILCLVFSLNATAQETYQGAENTKVEMADIFRQDGKIYVVVAVVGTVLLGLIFYAISLDRRLGRLERESHQET